MTDVRSDLSKGSRLVRRDPYGLQRKNPPVTVATAAPETIAGSAVFGSATGLNRLPRALQRQVLPALQPLIGNSGVQRLVQRAVSTNGGEFDTTTYTAVNSGAGVGKTVGAKIDVKFTPSNLVEADTIGLVQSVKTLRSTKAKGPVNDPSFVGDRNKALSLTKGDKGRAIDQGNDGVDLPNTNPFYAVENSAGNVSKTLTDVGADATFGTHGHNHKKPDGTFDKGDATLSDSPTRHIAFAGQQWQQTFEVTALVADGPMANTYLGSVEWGWSVDAKGDATLGPDPIGLVRAGAPTEQFMKAAKRWNAAKLKDPSTGKKHETVDLPLTSLDSGSVAAGSRTTPDLVKRIEKVNKEIKGLKAGVDRTNKQFEKRVLEAELATRPDRPAAAAPKGK